MWDGIEDETIERSYNPQEAILDCSDCNKKCTPEEIMKLAENRDIYGSTNYAVDSLDFGFEQVLKTIKPDSITRNKDGTDRLFYDKDKLKQVYLAGITYMENKMSQRTISIYCKKKDEKN